MLWVSAAGVCHPQADFVSLGVICLPKSERALERKLAGKKSSKSLPSLIPDEKWSCERRECEPLRASLEISHDVKLSRAGEI